MTNAEQARLVAWRLRILHWAAGEPRQVARTCRHFGISRTAFYPWKRRQNRALIAWMTKSSINLSTRMGSQTL
jgi:hypothetical protein